MICCAALAFLALAASSASARVVEVPWSTDETLDGPHSRDQARETAFRLAVFDEALDILPAALSLPRQELLRQYLLPRAADYVLSYSEAAPEPGAAAAPQAAPQADPAAPRVQTLAPEPAPAPERTLRLDVTVNRQGLKRMLQRMGVYYTAREMRTFDLGLEGDASGAWEELGRLQALSGLSVRRGVQPVLDLTAQWTEAVQAAGGKKAEPAALVWQGSLSLDENGQAVSWTAEGQDLAQVWFELWGQYFSRPGAEEGVVEQLPLAVSGWYAADGVRAFDKELSSWDSLVEGSVLLRVVMLPDGIGAVWAVRTLDRDALAARLGEALPERGLSWDFSDEPPAPQAAP